MTTTTTSLKIPIIRAAKKSTQVLPEPKSPSYVKVLVTKYKAKKVAKNIINSLKEVKDFESGKKTPKSFDDFLKTF